MARRRKGREISGWLAVDKPAGPTSSDAVNRVRRAFDARKAGHAGTLDPLATGVLAIAFGEATKTVPFVTDATKAYHFTIRFGQATDTDDAAGTVIAESRLRPGDAALAAALPRLTGTVMQAPPRYSAVKIDGARAHARARAGDMTAAPAPRPVRIDALTLLDRPDPDHAVLEMVCGKGAYVRAVARDLGAALGTHAHVTALRRTRSGPFDADDAVPLDRIAAPGDDPEALDSLLLPLETGLAGLPELRCTEAAAARLRNGNPAPVLTGADWGAAAWASHAGRAVAVGTYRAGDLHPARVFAR